MQFGFLQITSNLTITTTLLLQIIYVSNPPKFTQNFQSKVLAAISSNTLWSTICQPYALFCTAVHSLNHPP
jgi:hypothetical protein